MASLLASYGSPDALAVARDLDKKVETLLSEATIAVLPKQSRKTEEE
jgi:hypothetical protein